ncbi:10762_t:CDS:2 [Racocetra persica]|uniref:10762_t:CDS:1 n=1 Tax=Racocetra persica TaxID=160502 RepID=A0ACA9RNM5_9GLOM|nr:10762_t:CDS:2 [Racocetra persica]
MEFCDQEEHIKKECFQFKESVILRQHYQVFKEIFKTKDRDYLSKTAQEVESLPETEEKEKLKEEAINDKMEDSQKEAKQATTFSEAELTTRDELALDSPSFKDNNKENNPS